MIERQTVAGARSFLFVPATRPDRFNKAVGAGGDLVVVDLEDAVHPDAKQLARKELSRWLTSDNTPVVVRINAPGSPDAAADVELLRASPARSVAAVAIPKIESPDDIQQIDSALDTRVPVLPIIETALGLAAVMDIARAPNVVRLISGNLDLALDLGIDFAAGGDAVEAAAKFPIVLASRLAALRPPVDGPDTDFSQPHRVRESARRARALGFGGKICIHPAQVRPVHDGLAPTKEEAIRARQVLASAHDAPGAFKMDGRMVDKPVIEWARSVIRDLPNTTAGDTHDA